MERRYASAIEGVKAAKSRAKRTLSRAISLPGGRVSCAVTASAAEKVLSGVGGICCGLDDPGLLVVSVDFFGQFRYALLLIFAFARDMIRLVT